MAFPFEDPDLPGDPFQVLGVSSGYDDARALVGKRQGQDSADPPACAGHNGRLSAQPICVVLNQEIPP